MEASRLPLSIIIVGVGSANFQQMDILDGDTVRLSANGVYAERDIVQFVPYRDSRSWMATICPEIAGKWSSSYDGTSRLAKVKLAKEVLAEIPDQLTSFMKSRSILPMKRQYGPTTVQQPVASTSLTAAATTVAPASSSSMITVGVNGESSATPVAASTSPSAPPLQHEDEPRSRKSSHQGNNNVKGRKHSQQKLLKQSSSQSQDSSSATPASAPATQTPTNAKSNHNNNNNTSNSATVAAPATSKQSS